MERRWIWRLIRRIENHFSFFHFFFWVAFKEWRHTVKGRCGSRILHFNLVWNSGFSSQVSMLDQISYLLTDSQCVINGLDNSSLIEFQDRV